MKATNKQIRRAIRKYLEHTRRGVTNTRHITKIFAKGYKIPRQRVAGNLLPIVAYEKPEHAIITVIPNKRSYLKAV